MQLKKKKIHPIKLFIKTHIQTYSEHDRVCKLYIVDADSGNETDQSGNDVGVVHVYRFCYRLETKQQSLCMLVRTNKQVSKRQQKPAKGSFLFRFTVVG